MADKFNVRQVKIDEIQFDLSNANKGTERGRYALETSLRKYGAGRSVLIDKHGRLIAGGKTTETAGEIGIEDVIIVQTDGSKLVAVQRTDLDLDSKEARELAYADNRVGELDLSFDAEQVLADLQGGVDLSGLWFQWELDKLTGITGEGVDPAAEWQGMPEFEQDDLSAFKSLTINFATQVDVDAFSRLVEQTITDKTRSIWYPKAEIESYADKQYKADKAS